MGRSSDLRVEPMIYAGIGDGTGTARVMTDDGRSL